MDFSITEILQNCSSFGKIKSDFPIERFSCKVSIRVDNSLDDIDEVVCGIINSQAGEIEFNLLGDILGLSVYDRQEEKKYRDQAEVDVLNQLLSGVKDFNLISIGKGTNSLIALTELGRESINTKIKYRYINAKFTDYSADNIKGLAFNAIHSSFNIFPEFGDLQVIQSEKILSSCYLNKDLFNSIQNSCHIVSGYDNAKLISFNEPESYRNCNQSVIYKLFVHPTSCEEFVLVFKEDVLLNEISNAINDQQNSIIRSSIIRDIKFDTVWNNPDTLYGSDILNLYLDKWDWDKLIDKKIDWADKLIWEIFEDYGNANIWNKISFIAPIENILEQLTIRIEKWNWTLLSERLPDDVILSNIDNPFLRWDFDVLSLKSIEFLLS